MCQFHLLFCLPPFFCLWKFSFYCHLFFHLFIFSPNPSQLFTHSLSLVSGGKVEFQVTELKSFPQVSLPPGQTKYFSEDPSLSWIVSQSLSKLKWKPSTRVVINSVLFYWVKIPCYFIELCFSVKYRKTITTYCLVYVSCLFSVLTTNVSYLFTVDSDYKCFLPVQYFAHKYFQPVQYSDYNCFLPVQVRTTNVSDLYTAQAQTKL